MRKASQNERPKIPAGKSQPLVGIFWLVAGKLHIDATPFTEAEDYDDFKIHSGSHIDVWARLQGSGIAPIEMDYEEAPRGRVMYNIKTRRFTLLADKCILKDKRIVEQIVSELKVPSGNTEYGSDLHYRCFECLSAGRNEL